MAKTKTKTSKQAKSAQQSVKTMANGNVKPKETPEQLYASAIELVEQSQPDEALKKAKKLWTQVQKRSVTEALPALNLLGEISVELGDGEAARGYFEKAVTLDPTGEIPEAMGGGAEKFLWLAQLCEEGGQASVDWFERGVKALQIEIAALESGGVPGMDEESLLMLRVEKKRKLANALCGIVEVYMTDLSWEKDAEARCDALVTEAMAVEDETSAEVLQTLASVRLSQERREDARAALTRSLESWIELESEDAAVPDFATRVSLARLLMEAEMEQQAMQVLQRLHLMAEKLQAAPEVNKDGDADMSVGDQDSVMMAWKGSRNWLNMALKLFDLLDYEDKRLFEHAKALVAELDERLGPDETRPEGEDGAWEEWDGIADGDEDVEDGSANGDEDEVMQDL
ncbi:hypothetical protein LTR91_019261 [Friedmanniomyces endolithicus]|uniref:Assembly chaperone of rpl4 n=1 Tax=Friedmanniomyces endolithicus TaxID=329885 RepID=A0AAN6HBT2_9PEZI|nr:hypothetical protein LTR91_019261 [Friedmanniomyces endolithicus]